LDGRRRYRDLDLLIGKRFHRQMEDAVGGNSGGDLKSLHVTDRLSEHFSS